MCYFQPQELDDGLQSGASFSDGWFDDDHRFWGLLNGWLPDTKDAQMGLVCIRMHIHMHIYICIYTL